MLASGRAHRTEAISYSHALVAGIRSERFKTTFLDFHCIKM
jgi:hypothetical protein